MKKGVQEYRKTAALALASLLLIALCISSVSAIGVMGAKYMNSIAPGKTDVHNITISLSADDKATDVQIDVLGFGQTPRQNYITLEPAEDLSPYSARTFITLSQSTVHLEPGKSQTVTATIKVPQDVGSGGRYALISVHGAAKIGEFIATGVTIPVIITVSGTTPTVTGSIETVDMGKVILGQPITITTTLKNTGNYHYYNTKNNITIKDVNGNLVCDYSTNPSIFAIIPGNTVIYIATPEIQNLPVGTYTVNSKVIQESGTVLDEKSTTFEVKTNYVPPVTESNITLTPTSAGTLTSPDGRYSVSFPQGAVLGDALVTLKPYSKDQLKAAPTDANLGATSFEITGLTGLLNKDATVRVAYSADDLAAANGDATQLKLAYFDAAQGAWVILPTQVNTVSKTLTATTNHLSVWAIMVASSSTGETAPGAATTQSPVPMTVVLVSIIIAVIAIGSNTRKRK